MLKYIPTPRDFTIALNNTASMLSLKWKMLTNSRSRLVVILFSMFALFAVYVSSFIGQVTLRMAGQQSETAVRQIAYNYILSYTRGEIGTLGSIALSLAILSSLLAPFTGVISKSLFSLQHVAPMQASRLTRYTDSYVAQMFSSVSLLQLIALTAISSLVTLEGGQSWGIMYVWLSWPILVAISVFAAWGVEIIQRYVSLKNTLIGGSVVGVFLIVILTFYFEQAQTFFGLGDYYMETVRNLYTYDIGEQIVAFGSLVVVFLACVFVGGTLCLIALSHPEKATGSAVEDKPALLSWTKPTKVFESEIFLLMLKQIIRSPDSLRPITLVVIVGIPALLFFQGTDSIITAFIVAIPLLVACTWGVNFLGVMGGGVIWLANQPGGLKNLPWIAAFTQAAFTLALFFLIWTPPLVFGNFEWKDISVYAMAAISVTVLITRSSMDKAIKNPIATHPGIKGEALIPPGKMLSYTFRMTLWGCQYGIILLYLDIYQAQLSMMFLAVVWSAYRMYKLNQHWAKRETQVSAMKALHQA